MNNQIKHYIQRIIRRGIILITVGILSFLVHWDFDWHHNLISILFLPLGISKLLTGAYLKKKYKSHLEPPSFEAIDIMTEMPSFSWIAIFIVLIIGFIILEEVLKVSHAVDYGTIVSVALYILW